MTMRTTINGRVQKTRRQPAGAKASVQQVSTALQELIKTKKSLEHGTAFSNEELVLLFYDKMPQCRQQLDSNIKQLDEQEKSIRDEVRRNKMLNKQQPQELIDRQTAIRDNAQQLCTIANLLKSYHGLRTRELEASMRQNTQQVPHIAN